MNSKYVYIDTQAFIGVINNAIATNVCNPAAISKIWTGYRADRRNTKKQQSMIRQHILIKVCEKINVDSQNFILREVEYNNSKTVLIDVGLLLRDLIKYKKANKVYNKKWLSCKHNVGMGIITALKTCPSTTKYIQTTLMDNVCEMLGKDISIYQRFLTKATIRQMNSYTKVRVDGVRLSNAILQFQKEYVWSTNKIATTGNLSYSAVKRMMSGSTEYLQQETLVKICGAIKQKPQSYTKDNITIVI